MEQTLFDAGRLLEKLEIVPGQTIADFGAGSGFITLLCARKTGNTGTVYALDVLAESLEIVAAKAREQQLLNIKTIHANLEKPNGSTIADNSCDWVIVSNILFQSDQQPAILAEALRIAKPGGKVCIVDWYPEKIIIKAGHYPVGIPQIKEIAGKLNGHIKAELEIDPYHYGIIIEK